MSDFTMVDGRKCRYSTKEIAADVRKALKKEFPECKFSVTSKYFAGGSEMNVRLMEAPFPIFREDTTNEHVKWFLENGYCDVNHFWIGRDHHCEESGYTPRAVAVLRKANEIANAENWDNSDPMTDYFDVNFYFHMGVGRYDRPFICTDEESGELESEEEEGNEEPEILTFSRSEEKAAPEHKATVLDFIRDDSVIDAIATAGLPDPEEEDREEPPIGFLFNC